jgi:hypothetical protein
MLYVNGQLELDNIAATTNLGDSDLASLAQEYDSGPVTSDHFDGTLDEVKISRVVRSASWINAQYLSMDNKFITFGEEETKGLDRGAAYIFFGYPGIDLNNISAAYANVTINGTNTGDLFGWSVSDAGNVNGDSYDDIIIGAPGYGENQGKAYIFLGRAAGAWSSIDYADADSDDNLTGENNGDLFGSSVSGAGDVNNDNYDDVIVGAYGFSLNRGRAYIFYGPYFNMTGHAYSYAESLSLSELGSTATYTDYLTLTINPDVETRYLIIATSDVSLDDKVGDNTWLRLIINNTDVYHETNREFQDVTDWYHFSAMKYLYLDAGSHNIQLEYKTEGDNGRFRNTRIIAIEMDIPAGYYYENEGTVESTTTEVTAAETTFTTDTSGDYLVIATANVWVASSASSVQGRLYVDGTVYGETLIEPDDEINERFNFGVFKNITLSAGSHTIKLTVQSESTSVISSMNHAHLAAIPLDSFSEVHYNEAESQNSGPGGWETLVTHTYTPEETGEFFMLGTAAWYTSDATAVNGIRLQTSGTTRQESLFENRDGTDIHMPFQMDKRTVSSSQTDRMSQFMNSGGWSKFARIIALPLDLDYVRITGESYDDRFGLSVSNAGDVDNSGNDDVIIGAPGADQAFIVYGSGSLSDSIDATSANVILSGTASTDFGWSVGNASDVNSDGTYDDVIVGAPGTTNGNAYIYYGGSPMNTVADITLTGEAAGDKFGYSVHYAGDIDGDGDPDVIVGAPYHTESGRTECGALYLYLGGSDIDSTIDYENYGEYAYDHFGWSVSHAGNVNDDLFNETFSSAPDYDTQVGETPASASDAGKAYVHVIPEFSDFAFGLMLIAVISIFVSFRRKKAQVSL